MQIIKGKALGYLWKLLANVPNRSRLQMDMGEQGASTNEHVQVAKYSKRDAHMHKVAEGERVRRSYVQFRKTGILIHSNVCY